MRNPILLITVTLAACGMFVIAQLTGQQTGAPQPAGPYTSAQTSAGREAYQANCAACHAPDLSGREGPQLAGGTFMNQWGDKTAADLISFMRATMPPAAAESLPDQ